MPTLMISFGMRFFFYMDEHQPIHVHVDGNGKKAKIVLEPTVFWIIIMVSRSRK